ncbi:MAG: 50S ribosomal protein L25 [Nitrospiria bacterium]
MEKIQIEGQYRNTAGKGMARKLRREGKIPAVIYSKGSSKPLILNPKEVDAARHSGAGENAVITLNVTGEDQGVIATHVVILRDFQKDPITGDILHADLFEISMSEKIDVKVPIEIVGSVPVGVKKDGGSLRHQLRELEIRCLPSEIPDHIQVDASDLGVGETIHVSDILLSKEIQVMDPQNLAVVSITASISEEKLEALLSSTPEEGKSPEVVGQKKDEEAEASKEAKEPKKS